MLFIRVDQLLIVCNSHCPLESVHCILSRDVWTQDVWIDFGRVDVECGIFNNEAEFGVRVGFVEFIFDASEEGESVGSVGFFGFVGFGFA